MARQYQRAANAPAQQAQQQEPQGQSRKIELLATVIERTEMRQQMEMLLPSWLTFERMTTLTRLAFAKDRNLRECTPGSIAQALLQAATLGLEINTGLGHAYLVPYKGECQLIVGYRGLIFLAHRAGALVKAEARLVYEGEVFDVEYGTNPRIIHKPNWNIDRTDVNAIVGAYCVAWLPNGHTTFEPMNRGEIERIRARSKAQNGPWSTDFGEMARKTPTRRLMKYLPVSNMEEGKRLAAALELDDRFESGTIGDVIPELDTEESLSRAAQEHTIARMEELRQRMQPAGDPPGGVVEENELPF